MRLLTRVYGSVGGGSLFNQVFHFLTVISITLMAACMRMSKSGCGQDNICLEVHYNSLVNLHACIK